MVVGLIADVQPTVAVAVMFHEEEVEVQMVDHPEVPLPGRVNIGYVQVGGTSQDVERGSKTVQGLIKCRTAVAAEHGDGLSHVVAQRLQHLAAQLSQVEHHLPRRHIVDAQPLGRLMFYKLAQPEVLAEHLVGVIYYLFHHRYVFVLRSRPSGLIDNAKIGITIIRRKELRRIRNYNRNFRNFFRNYCLFLNNIV